MESQKTKEILDRYWAAESTAEEEKELKSGRIQLTANEDKKYAVLFDYMDKTRNAAPDQPFDLSFLTEPKAAPDKGIRLFQNRALRWTAGIAATLALSIGSVMYQWPTTVTLTAQQQQIDQAYSETLAALEKVANTLQAGNASIMEIGVFDKTKKQIIDENY